jgi:hypothetical protein
LSKWMVNAVPAGAVTLGVVNAMPDAVMSTAWPPAEGDVAGDGATEAGTDADGAVEPLGTADGAADPEAPADPEAAGGAEDGDGPSVQSGLKPPVQAALRTATAARAGSETSRRRMGTSGRTVDGMTGGMDRI